MPTLIATPLSLEFEALCQAFESQGFEKQPYEAGRLKLAHFPKAGFYCATVGHGKAQFGVQTQFLLNHFNGLSAVLCVGSAGALTESILPGDVVVGEATVEHDYRLKFIQRPLPRFAADMALLAKFRKATPTSYGLHLGSIASGDEDILDVERARELKEQTQALAVAWEGAGGARAAKFNGVPFLEIRAITDMASSTAAVDFNANLKNACANAAQLICDALCD